MIADSQPVSGLSAVSEWVERTLNSQGKILERIDTSVNRGRRNYAAFRLIAYLKAVRAVVEIERNTTIYIPIHHGVTLLPQTFIAMIVILRNMRLIVHHHSFLPITKPNILMHRFAHGLIFKKAEHIFLTERMESAYVKVWGNSLKNWVVYNDAVAVDRLKNFTFDRIDKGNNIVLMHASNLTVAKGSYFTLELFDRILRKYPNVSCILLGPTSDDGIAFKIKSVFEDFPDRFTYISSFDTSTLATNLRRSDIFVFPSSYSNEASPLVLLEAQYMGNIVLGSDVGAISEIVLQPGRVVALNEFQATLENLVNQFFKNIKPSLDAVDFSRIIINRGQIARETLSLIFGED